jgi:hypothetical protein
MLPAVVTIHMCWTSTCRHVCHTFSHACNVYHIDHRCYHHRHAIQPLGEPSLLSARLQQNDRSTRWSPSTPRRLYCLAASTSKTAIKQTYKCWIWVCACDTCMHALVLGSLTHSLLCLTRKRLLGQRHRYRWCFMSRSSIAWNGNGWQAHCRCCGKRRFLSGDPRRNNDL